MPGHEVDGARRPRGALGLHLSEVDLPPLAQLRVHQGALHADPRVLAGVFLKINRAWLNPMIFLFMIPGRPSFIVVVFFVFFISFARYGGETLPPEMIQLWL